MGWDGRVAQGPKVRRVSNMESGVYAAIQLGGTSRLWSSGCHSLATEQFVSRREEFKELKSQGHPNLYEAWSDISANCIEITLHRKTELCTL